MNRMIDLTPYLPQQHPVASAAAPRRRRRFGSAAAAVEAVVSLCIGAGFLLMLTAFLGALIF